MSGSESEPTVLVVDDEPEVADAYGMRLELEYEVETAYGGSEALETVDESVDVLLLDRRMPEVSGDEVLEEVRSADLGVRVIMVTAVTPDFDVMEMPFDDYLCKPVERDALYDAIDQQLEAAKYQDAVSEYFSITAKQSILEEDKSPAELERNEEYQKLEARADELRERMDDSLDEFDDLNVAFKDIDRV
ncbi:response regulator [Halostella litorea]|uniref:response regulator n=1 Tax=Halostella litorea TaxID=2528831 RepID=UPI00109246E5|nr:HalX domain-containing protein [Halostella litorea]